MNKTKLAILTLIILFGLGVTSGAQERVIVVANSIDYDMASEFIAFLENRGVEVVHFTTAEFNQYKGEKFIIILGGPDAYDGVGEMVEKILSSAEQSAIRTKGNRMRYVKTDPWGHNSDQQVVIMAGSDRNQTKKSHEENRDILSYEVEEAYALPFATFSPSYTPPPESPQPQTPPPSIPPTATASPLLGAKWSKTFGGTEIDSSSSVQQTSDGGYILAGETSSFGAGKADIYLIKTDNDGDEVWSKTFGGTESDRAYSVQQTSDGGYIVAGLTESFGAGGADVYLIKTDSAGSKVWSKTFGGAGADSANSVHQTTDGGYIIAGYSTSFGSEQWGDVYLIKTDDAGSEVWSKTFGGEFEDMATSIQQTSDGGYIITGYTYPLGTEDMDVYLIKTDSNGSEVWSKRFGDTERDRADSVQQTADGGYIIAGSTQAYRVQVIYDVYLIKTDSEGSEVWSKTFGEWEGDSAKSVQQTADGGYIIAGDTISFETGMDVYLIKTDSSGNLSWSKTFGGANHDSAISIQQTADGGYIMAGYTKSFGAGNWDVFLIKTDE